MYKHFFKRIFDICIALFALIFIIPLLLVFTLWLHFVNKGKPFYTQFRPGKNEPIFKVIKFKTMNDKRGANGAFLPDLWKQFSEVIEECFFNHLLHD